MSVSDDDVKKLFDQTFQARRARAEIADAVRKAELVLEQARSELENADETIARLEQRMQELADRAAGVAPRITDEPLPSQMFAGYRPIVRS